MPGRELSEEELESLKAGALALSAKMRAVRIVSAANVSKKDLKERLVRKGEDPDQADAAVKWMEDMAILDDGRTAREVVEKCIARGYGLNRTKQMLYEKKIPKEYWDEALANYPDQQEAIASFLSARLKDPGDRREVKRGPWMPCCAGGILTARFSGPCGRWKWKTTMISGRNNKLWQRLDLFPWAAPRTRWTANG